MTDFPWSDELTLDSHGIWRTTMSAPVSYPENDSDTCFQLEDTSFWFAHRNRVIAAVLDRFPPAGILLDLGAGNGFVAQHLQRCGHRVAALEPSTTGAENCRLQRGLGQVICAEFVQADLHSESVPSIGAFDVLEHIEGDADAVAEIARVLTPNGMFYGTVPAHMALWSGSDVEAGHYRRYGRAALLRLLDPHFDVLFTSGFFKPLIVPQFLVRAVPYRLRLPTPSLAGGDKAHAPQRTNTPEGIMTKLLRRETARIAGGSQLTLGASLVFAARRKPTA